MQCFDTLGPEIRRGILICCVRIGLLCSIPILSLGKGRFLHPLSTYPFGLIIPRFVLFMPSLCCCNAEFCSTALLLLLPLLSHSEKISGHKILDSILYILLYIFVRHPHFCPIPDDYLLLPRFFRYLAVARPILFE